MDVPRERDDKMEQPVVDAPMTMTAFQAWLQLEREKNVREFAERKAAKEQAKAEKEEALRIQREALEVEKQKAKAEIEQRERVTDQRIAAIKLNSDKALEMAQNSLDSFKEVIAETKQNTAAIAEIRTELATVKDECAQAKSVSESAVQKTEDLGGRFENVERDQKTFQQDVNRLDEGLQAFEQRTGVLEGGLATLREKLSKGATVSQETKAEVFEKHAEVLQIEERLGIVEQRDQQLAQRYTNTFADHASVLQELQQRVASLEGTQSIEGSSEEEASPSEEFGSSAAAQRRPPDPGRVLGLPVHLDETTKKPFESRPSHTAGLPPRATAGGVSSQKGPDVVERKTGQESEHPPGPQDPDPEDAAATLNARGGTEGISPPTASAATAAMVEPSAQSRKSGAVRGGGQPGRNKAAPEGASLMVRRGSDSQQQ